LTSAQKKNEIIASWFLESEVDLHCAKTLYETGVYSRSLYHLQQSNEKLAKGLLLSIGILSPRKEKQSETIKTIVGFKPKEPSAYRHRTFPSFIADMSLATPALDEIIKSINWKGSEEILSNFQATIKRSKKGIQKLKKKPSGPITSNEQIEKEIKAINVYLDKIIQVKDNLKLALDNLNPEKATRVALQTVQDLKLTATKDQASEAYSKTTKRIIPIIELSFLVSLSVAVASFLDPLESITRYPDSNHGPFTKDDIYVKHFKELHDILKRTLEKARANQKEQTEKEHP